MPLNITLSSHHIRLRLFTIEDSRDLVTAASRWRTMEPPFHCSPFQQKQ